MLVNLLEFRESQHACDTDAGPRITMCRIYLTLHLRVELPPDLATLGELVHAVDAARIPFPFVLRGLPAVRTAPFPLGLNAAFRLARQRLDEKVNPSLRG